MDNSITGKLSAKDKILWHGTLLDAKLTFVLPEKPLPCEHTEAGDIVLVYVVSSHDVMIVNHIHLDDHSLKNLDQIFPQLYAEITAEYLEVVAQQLIEKIRNGSKLH